MGDRGVQVEEWEWNWNFCGKFSEYSVQKDHGDIQRASNSSFLHDLDIRGRVFTPFYLS